MKFIKSLLGASAPDQNQYKPDFPWMPLKQMEYLDNILEDSHKRPQVIFKHSTSCGLSGMLLRRFQKTWEQYSDQADFHLLDLIGYRAISNAIEDKLGVRHQSPQVILLYQGEVRDEVSHGSIGGLHPEQALKNPA